MKAENLIGTHSVSDGSVQDLIDVLSQMSPKSRRNSFVRLVVGDDIYDLRAVQMAQSDQAEPHELKVYLRS
jgi:hypothetical protein